MVTLQVNAQDTSKVKSVDTKQILYSIKYSLGENYDSTKSIYKQDLTEHGRYMQKLFNKGKLILAGPFNDNSDGQVIIQAYSEKEAITMMQNDPAVLKNIFKWGIASLAHIFQEHKRGNFFFEKKINTENLNVDVT